MKLAHAVLYLLCLFSLNGVAADIGVAENQIELCETNLQAVLEKLSLFSKPDKIRSTGFFETRGMELYNKQFFVRVRRSKNKVELTFKKNAPSMELWRDNFLECETDVHKSYSKQSCSYHVNMNLKNFKALKASPKMWQEILSPQDQYRFNQMSDAFDFSHLYFVGEVSSYKWEWVHKGRLLVLDVWLMPPDNEPMMEISTRSDIKDSTTFSLVEKYLSDSGLTVCSPSEGRTLRLLKYLSCHDPDGD